MHTSCPLSDASIILNILFRVYFVIDRGKFAY